MIVFELCLQHDVDNLSRLHCSRTRVLVFVIVIVFILISAHTNTSAWTLIRTHTKTKQTMIIYLAGLVTSNHHGTDLENISVRTDGGDLIV